MDVPAFLAVPTYVAAGALVAAAMRKLVRPQQTYIALRLIGVPNGRGAVVSVASVEVATGVAVIVAASVPSLVVMGVLYLVFTGFLLRARSVGVACGCLTDADRPPGWVHIGLDACAALISFLAAASTAST